MAQRLARVKNIIDTTANWMAVNPVLLSGEIGIEIKSGGEVKVKIGDGNTAWNLLGYVSFTPSEITAIKDNLQSQINEIVVTASEGGDVEVAQARVNASGTVYETLKARLDGENTDIKSLIESSDNTLKSEIDEEIEDLNDSVTDLSKDVSILENTSDKTLGLLDKSFNTDYESISYSYSTGRYISSSGEIITSETSYGTTNYIDISGDLFLYIECRSGYGNGFFAFYDAENKYISGEFSSSGQETYKGKIDVPKSAKYIVLSDIGDTRPIIKNVKKYVVPYESIKPYFDNVNSSINNTNSKLNEVEKFVYESQNDYGYSFCKWARDSFEWKAGTGSGFNNSTLTYNVPDKKISLVVNSKLSSNATVQFSGNQTDPAFDYGTGVIFTFHSESTVSAQLQVVWYDSSGTATTIGRNIAVGENDYTVDIPNNAKTFRIAALRYISTDTGSVVISNLSIVPVENKPNKTHIIFSFDASGQDMINDQRYAIVKGEYGWNFNFSISSSNFSDGNKAAIKSGCDIGLYTMTDWPGNNDTVNGTSEENITAWKNYVNNAIAALRNEGYYYPISWNCRQGVSGKNLEDVCKLNEIGIVRGYYKGASDRSSQIIQNRDWYSKPFTTATASSVNSVKSNIDTAIANGYDLCIVSHALYNDATTADANYSLTPSTLREILDYVKDYVDEGEATVCTFREYYKEIDPDGCYELDYKRLTAMSV